MKISEVVYKKPTGVERFTQRHSMLQKHGIETRAIDTDAIKKMQQPTTTPTATKAASTTIPALKPDQVAFLDINGSKVFLSKDGKNWMIYQGANWPQDLGTSQVITAQNSLDAIDAAMAAGKLQIASTKKTANFSKPGFSGYQTK